MRLCGYEFLVYRLLRKALEAGNVYVRDSNEYRSFEDDLIRPERWKNKAAVLEEIGSPVLLAPIEETLATFHAELEEKFERVNRRLESGDNKHVKIVGTGDKRRWSLIYPSEEEPINSPFYGQLPGIGIADLLRFVAGKTNFMKTFTHVLGRYIKQDADPRHILACAAAMGTNMGLWKMAEVSGLGVRSASAFSRMSAIAALSFAGVCANTIPRSSRKALNWLMTAVRREISRSRTRWIAWRSS